MENELNMFRNYENRILGIGDFAKKLPVVLVTGFLGSGKTTLVNYLLSNKSNLRVAVLVNDVAEVNIDSQLLKSHEHNAAFGIGKEHNLANGCMCCTVSEELKQSLAQVLNRRDMIDYLIVETSGLSDPRPIAEMLANQGRLDMVVTVVDASNARAHLGTPTGMNQLKSADTILLNKVDKVEQDELSKIEEMVLEAAKTGPNANAKVIRCEYGNVPLQAVLDVDITAVEANGDGDEGFMSHETVKRLPKLTVGGQPHFHNKAPHRGTLEHQEGGSHGIGVAFKTSTFSSDKPLSMARFQKFMSDHFNKSEGILRAKGVLWFKECRTKKFMMHVSGRMHIDIELPSPWAGEAQVQFVMIGKGEEVMSLRESLEECILESTPRNSAEDAKVVVQKLLQNDYMESVECDENNDEDTGLIRFSLRGSRAHGIYSSDLNKALVGHINMSKALFCTLVVENGVHVVQTATGCIDPDTMLATILHETDHVIEKHYKGVHQCRCGF